MQPVNDDKWLDEALEGVLHSNDTRPDFQKWMARHPEAVETLTAPKTRDRSVTKTIRLNAWFGKLAVAAVIAIVAIIGITQLTQPDTSGPGGARTAQAETLTGPLTHTLDDGSVVALAADASIRTYGEAGKRGFEHVMGTIDVTVVEGQGEFIVTTPYGEVKALGTEFTLEMVNGTADSGERVELLSVEVTEGRVEVSNSKGREYLEAAQDGIVAKDVAPYDFNQDEALPDQLKERIQAMVDAFAAGDAAAWATNFNINYVYKLIKGQVEYDPLLFGGSQEDAERLGETLKDIESREQLAKVFASSVNITEPIKIYVRSVELSSDGNHARAQCVHRKSQRSMTITRPQWHYFENDWWQIDD